jgi:hypothetical protein
MARKCFSMKSPFGSGGGFRSDISDFLSVWVFGAGGSLLEPLRNTNRSMFASPTWDKASSGGFYVKGTMVSSYTASPRRL